MNLEKLEKLNELRENGILTQEEFEKQKKELLMNDGDKISTFSEGKFSLKNFFLSLLGTLIFLVAFLSLQHFVPIRSLWFIGALMFAAFPRMFLDSVKSQKYKKCMSPTTAAWLGLFFGPLGLWIAWYQYLQIKQGNAVLKEPMPK